MKTRKTFVAAFALLLVLSGCGAVSNAPTQQTEEAGTVGAQTGGSEEQSQTQEPAPAEESSFDALAKAEALFAKLDGAGGYPWRTVGEDPYEGAPILIAMPENAFSDILQGCVVTAWDPAEYDSAKRFNELEAAGKDMPGQAIWMGSSEELMVELRAMSPDALCWQPSKERLGWAVDLAPTLEFEGVAGSGNRQEQVETVAMPNLVGVTEGEAKTWLGSNGYKFTLTPNYGFNPRLSLCLGGKGLITAQTPRAGTEVKNVFGTTVRVDVDCEWR